MTVAQLHKFPVNERPLAPGLRLINYRLSRNCLPRTLITRFISYVHNVFAMLGTNCSNKVCIMMVSRVKNFAVRFFVYWTEKKFCVRSYGQCYEKYSRIHACLNHCFLMH